MESKPEAAASLPDDSPESQTNQHYPAWVGCVMAIFLPGSAHFLAGQRRFGILCWPILLFGQLLLVAVVGIPGTIFLCATILLAALCLLYYLAVIVSSWRPTCRIGCLGWLLFPIVILGLNYAVVLPCVLFLKTYVTEAFVITGASMSPTMIAPSESAPEVRRSDRVFVSKIIYRLGDPKRGDVVVYRTTSPADGSPTVWTHRVVGLPGETIDIDPPYVAINGERLTEPPIFEKIAAAQDGLPGYCTAEEAGGQGIELPLTLGPDEYFLLGDNSPRSLDSRFRGVVLRKNIVGRVIRIYHPLNRIREVE